MSMLMAPSLVVIDTSAIIAVITNEAHKSALIGLTTGVDLLAPSSLPLELGNAFSAMFKQRRMTLEEAKAAFVQYKKIPIRLTEIDLPEALELSSRLAIYAYDAYVIQCGLLHGVPLLTLDGGQKEAALRAGLQVLEVPP